jgi:beta-mannosidase
VRRRTLILLGVTAAAGSSCGRSVPARPKLVRPVPVAPPRRTLPLSGPWQLRTMADSARPAPRDTDVREWLPAQVPGCVHTDLLASGKIPEPFFGKNEQELQWIGERDWEYQTQVLADAALLAEERIELVFGGLDTFATVLLNDVPILQADNMFREWRVPVSR